MNATNWARAFADITFDGKSTTLALVTTFGSGLIGVLIGLTVHRSGSFGAGGKEDEEEFLDSLKDWSDSLVARVCHLGIGLSGMATWRHGILFWIAVLITTVGGVRVIAKIKQNHSRAARSK